MSIVSEKSAANAGAKRSKTLSQHVESQIESDIVEGVFKPGDRLDEEELASRLGVSRTPIREALRKLAAAQLITIRPRSGASVCRMTMAKIIDLFEVVSELEAFAARLAATRATDTQMEVIQSAHRKCEGLARTGDARSYFDANYEFHTAIWAAANNQALVEQITAVDKRLTPYRRQITFHPHRKQDSQSEHDQIATALGLRQPDIAERAMREHVMILADDALQMARDLRL